MITRYLTRIHLQSSIIYKALTRIQVTYSTDNTNFPTTCPGINYMKDGKDLDLKPDSEYPDWLWTLGGPKKDFKDMSPEIDGVAYYRREKKIKLREKNLIRKQRKF